MRGVFLSLWNGGMFVTTQQKEQIAILRSQGESYARIADTLGLSENTVKSYCRRNGIVTPTAENPESSVKCASCSQPLVQTPGARNKRFCSDICRMQWWYRHPEAMKRSIEYHFTCPVCGMEFISYSTSKRIYCSRACFGVARKSTRG